MSYQVYKVLHYLGFMMIFFGLGGVFVSTLSGQILQGKARVAMAIAHGLGLILMLVAGFGMIAKTGMTQGEGLPPWIYGKIAIWVYLGAAIALVKRKATLALMFILFAIAIIAPILVVYKTTN